MRTLVNDAQRELTVVEDGELRRYELLVAGTTVGTLDFRVLSRRRVLGHTEIAADQRGRGLATALIKAVLDDLIAEGVRITNYCTAVERFLQRHPEYVGVLDPLHPPIQPRSGPRAGGRQQMDRSGPLQQVVHAQHSRLRELAARSQDPSIDGFERRRITDQFAAVAAQHAAAVADVLLTAARTSSGEDAAVLLENLRQFEQALRVLKGRAYGDASWTSAQPRPGEKPNAYWPSTNHGRGGSCPDWSEFMVPRAPQSWPEPWRNGNGVRRRDRIPTRRMPESPDE